MKTTTEKMLKQRGFPPVAIKAWKQGKLVDYDHEQRMRRQATSGRARRAGRLAQ